MAAAKKKTKRKATKKKNTKAKKQVQGQLTLNWKKPVAILAALFLTLWAGTWFFLSDYDTKLADATKSGTLDLSGKAGFKVKNILVEGRKYTDADVLLALINVGEGDPIFLFEPTAAKEQIEKISWVRSARVERRLPDTIYIDLIEREPMALWRHEEQLSLIDADGAILTQDNLDEFKDLFMITGKGAPQKTPPLVILLENHPEFLALIDHAELIDKRRWDVVLKDGKRIKLPQHNKDLAIKALVEKHAEHQILTQKAVRDIDARYKGRLIVRTRLGTVQDYKAGISETSL